MTKSPFTQHDRTGYLLSDDPSLRVNQNVVDFRRFAAAADFGVAAGVPPKVMSERLGRATVAFILDTYTSALPALDKPAAEVVAGPILGTDVSKR